MISNKMKKLVLGGSLLFATGLVGLSASCGGGGENKPVDPGTNPGTGIVTPTPTPEPGNPGETSARYDVPATSDITIGVTWSTGKDQWNTFSAIIDVYNKKMKDQPGFKPVNLVNLGSGYGEGAKKITNELNSEVMAYNGIFNYASVAAKLAQKDMLLDFNEPGEANTIPLTTFNERFLSSNKTTEFIKNNSGQGLYMLPYAKSSTVFAINAPVLYYIIKNMLDNGATLKEGDTKMAKFYEELKAKGSHDYSGVQSLWGTPVDNAATLVNNMVISYDIFENYLPLIEFSEVAQKMFSESGKPNAVSQDIHVFGIDDPAGLFETNVFQDVNADYKNSLFATVTNDGRNTVNYKALITDGSPTQNKAKAIYEKYLEAMKVGALVLNEGGIYSSQGQIKHRYAFSIGSSAGYTHSYISSNDRTETFSNKTSSPLINQDLNISSNRDNVLTFDVVPANANAEEQTAFLNKVFPPKDGKENKNLKPEFKTDFSKLIAFVGKYNNPIFASTYGDLDSYQYKLVSGYDDVAKTAFSAEGVNSESKLLLFRPKDSKNPALKFLKDVKSKLKNSSKGIFAGEMQDKEGKYSILVISKDGSKDGIISVMTEIGYTYVPSSEFKELSKEEGITLESPTKWSSENTKKVVYAQGPSLIGIHTNNDGDAAMRMFVHWLVTNNDSYKFLKIKRGKDDPKNALIDQPQQITPYFEQNASYIVAKDLSNLDISIFKNPYLQVAAQSFILAAEDPNTVVYETPGSLFGDAYREKLGSSLSNVQKSFINGNEGQSFTQFINDLKQNNAEIFK